MGPGWVDPRRGVSRSNMAHAASSGRGEARVSRLTELLPQARKADPRRGGAWETEIIALTKRCRVLAAADRPPRRSGGAPSNLCLMSG